MAVHVEDLHALILEESLPSPPAIIGHSWGAMLALAHAAAHPESAGPIALVGCGTFDAASRARMHEIERERTDDVLDEKLARLEAEVPDAGERQLRKHEVTRALYTFHELGPARQRRSEDPPFDKKAHGETWSDMMRLQAEGVFPSAFAAIRSPVLMIHGDYDPHPGEMIRDCLLPFIPQLEYHRLERCGHNPWEELHAHDAFFALLRTWGTAGAAWYPADP